MSITTRRGDTGETDLLFGCRVQKDYPRIDAIGCVDELNAALGVVRLTATGEAALREVPLMQKTLIALMGELATPPGRRLATRRHIRSVSMPPPYSIWMNWCANWRRPARSNSKAGLFLVKLVHSAAPIAMSPAPCAAELSAPW